MSQLDSSCTIVHVNVGSGYEVHVGAGVSQPDNLERQLARLLPDSPKTLGLSDRNVAALYPERLQSSHHVVEAGEDSKSLTVLEGLLNRMATEELDRSSILWTLGGGVVGDLGGLAASLYMRGIACVQCPSTLLAQVDSSVGGKTAVNLAAGKNLAGSFHQPALVLADTQLLASLPCDEFRSGLGEVLKTCLLSGEPDLSALEAHAQHLGPQAELGSESALAACQDLVVRCVRTKASIVAQDPHEKGPRKSLNLGHTFAHAIEHCAGYGRIPHGIAVACGIGLALAYAHKQGSLTDPSLLERFESLSQTLGLPLNLAQLRQQSGLPLGSEELKQGMRHDKKGAAGRARLTLLHAVGDWSVDQPADDGLLGVLFS